MGTPQANILKAYADFRSGQRKTGHIPYLRDSRAARRIVDILLSTEK